MEENENTNYEMPTTEMNEMNEKEGGGDKVGSELTKVIESTNNLNPTKFWMVFMMVLSFALGSILIFGSQYLTSEIKDLKEEKVILQKELKECPDVVLERFKKQQIELQNLKRVVMMDAGKLDTIEKNKEKVLEKIQQINNIK